MADFDKVARRTLTAAEYKLFRFHYLLGADYRLCGPRPGLDRGQFYRAAYRIEEQMGRAYAELKPFPLYPPRDYFAQVLRPVAPCPAAGEPTHVLRAPVRRVA
jgi:hypothetical protein